MPARRYRELLLESGLINKNVLMAFRALRSQNLDEERASARSRQDYEIIGARNVTVQQRGSFARLFQRKPLKTRQFSAGLRFTGKRNFSRQNAPINGA